MKRHNNDNKLSPEQPSFTRTTERHSHKSLSTVRILYASNLDGRKFPVTCFTPGCFNSPLSLLTL